MERIYQDLKREEASITAKNLNAANIWKLERRAVPMSGYRILKLK
jgi:hypothetical protein